MAAIALKNPLPLNILVNKGGCVSVFYVKSSKYSTERKPNLAAYKRGTGGRSSFNGIVATVFGCSGFVGRYVCNRLGKIGTQLILPHRNDHYDCCRLKCAGDLGQVLFQPFDLRDKASLYNAVKYSNVVINLIGRDYETKNFSFHDVHVEGARSIARACLRAGVERLIHLSYLNSDPHPTPLVLSKPSQFKITKHQGEEIIREEFPDATIIKASDIYGSEDRFLKSLVHAWRRQGKYMPLYKNGEETIKQPVYVSDVAQAIVNVARDPDTKGQVYQAVGPKRYKLGELVDWFHRVMRKGPDWGYMRYDMRWDPSFAMKVTINNMLSPAYPFAYLHWEGLEKEATTDVVKDGVPTLEDLGITLTPMENQVPWELRPHRAHSYYMEEVGEFEKPAPPRVVS